MPKTEIHGNASIDPSARIGEGCRIGPFAVIEPDTVLGQGCRISAHAVIKRYSTLGSNNQVMEGAVIGGLPQDFKFEDQESYVRIGDRNTFREHVTINRSTTHRGSTIIGNECFFMAYAHVAHECGLGNQVVMANAVQLAGHVSIQDSAFLSGGVVIHQFCRIGRLAMVGGNSKVVKDVPPFCLADGVPARLRDLNLVGLRRVGTLARTLEDLKSAYRILCSQAPKDERLARLDELACPEAQQIADFIRQSQRSY